MIIEVEMQQHFFPFKKRYLNFLLILFIGVMFSFFALGEESYLEKKQEEASDNSALYVSIDSIEKSIQTNSEELIPYEKSQEVKNLIDDKSSEIKDLKKNSENEENLMVYYDYVTLDSLTTKVESFSSIDAKTSTEDDREISYVLYNNGKKEIETSMKYDKKVIINKEELTSLVGSSWKKEIIVYSEEHFENSLKVYSDIVETEKKYIKLYWKNEGKELTDEIEFYDTNNNGYYDRISWNVPHLSRQIFEIVINMSGEENSSTTNLIIVKMSAPNGTYTSNNSLPPFSFYVNYTMPSLVSCNFSLFGDNFNFNQSNLGWNSTIASPISLANGNYSWNIFCFADNFLNDSKFGDFFVNINYTPKVLFSVNQTEINVGGNVLFIINVSLVENSPIAYNLYFGDGESSSFATIGNSIYKTILHSYSSNGTKKAYLNLTAGTYSLNLSHTINVFQNNFNDSEPPEIRMIRPYNNQNIVLENQNDIIEFVYNATDNVKLQNCTFELYFYNGSIGRLVYSNFNESILKGQQVSIRITDFDEGDYSWGVICYDNSSNKAEKERDFSVSYELRNNESSEQQIMVLSTNRSTTLISEEEVSKIDDAINLINDFFILAEKFSVDEKEAAEDLGLIDNLTLHKKRLIQMKQDLEHNLAYIRDETQRERRRQEILKEVDSILKRVPIDFAVTGSYEFYKNSLDIKLSDIIEDYIAEKTIVASSAAKAQMVKENQKIQNFIIVSSKVKKVEIEYKLDSEKITLVSKTIKIKNNSFDSFLEVIPKGLSKEGIVFLNPATSEVKDAEIFEIPSSNLIKDKIIYYFKEILDAKEIEKTNTLAFEKKIPSVKISAISGFATFVFSSGNFGIWFYLSWIIAIFVFLFILAYSIKGAKIRKWEKNKETRELFKLIKKAEGALKDKDVETAKEHYYKIREAYSFAPIECKKIVVKKIKKIQLSIDRKDMSNLIKEFLDAKRGNREEDAVEVYEKIKKIYHRMPKKYKRQVYQKVVPYINYLKKSKEEFY